jgi:hypothetical protein
MDDVLYMYSKFLYKAANVFIDSRLDYFANLYIFLYLQEMFALINIKLFLKPNNSLKNPRRSTGQARSVAALLRFFKADQTIKRPFQMLLYQSPQR